MLHNDAVKRRNGFFLAADSPQDKTVEVGPGNLKMSFSRTTGQLKRMYNSRTGVSCILVDQTTNC